MAFFSFLFVFFFFQRFLLSPDHKQQIGWGAISTALHIMNYIYILYNSLKYCTVYIRHYLWLLSVTLVLLLIFMVLIKLLLLFIFGFLFNIIAFY